MTESTGSAGNRRTATEVLDAFDDEFAAVASGVARGEYTLWVGSGISRDVVPDLAELLLTALDFLQRQVVFGNPDCRFRIALSEIIECAHLSDGEIDAINMDVPVRLWPKLDDLLARLSTAYSHVLEVAVDGEDAEDFLLWEAMDVRATYGDPSLEPDVEHLCLGILMLEGVIPVTASANWDSLIEQAWGQLAGNSDGSLRVLVHNDEFRDLPEGRCDLIKFHGCAAKAAEDPDRYRRMLVARKRQIAGWAQNPDYAATLRRLVDLAATRPSLMIGLSAQDANIQEIFSQAKNVLGWSWPSDSAPIVFAEESMGLDQRVILGLQFGEEFHANRKEIESSALLGCYAKPLLLGLVLYTLAHKLTHLIDESDAIDALDITGIESLKAGVLNLRDALGRAASGNSRSFTVGFIESVSLVLSSFRGHDLPKSGELRYTPLTSQPMRRAVGDANIPIESLRAFAIVLSLLGWGNAEGRWEVLPGASTAPHEGAVRIASGSGAQTRTFIVRDTVALAKLVTNGYTDLLDPATLVLHTSPPPDRQARSPATSYGRTGRATAREVDVPAILGDATTAEDLLRLFQQEAVL